MVSFSNAHKIQYKFKGRPKKAYCDHNLSKNNISHSISSPKFHKKGFTGQGDILFISAFLKFDKIFFYN